MRLPCSLRALRASCDSRDPLPVRRGLWAASTDHFADDEEHDSFQTVLIEDLNSHDRRFNLAARRSGPGATCHAYGAHARAAGAQVRAETLTLLATTGRHEETRRWRLCEIYVDVFRQVGPDGAPGLVWISRSDKTHKVCALRRFKIVQSDTQRRAVSAHALSSSTC